MQAFSSPFSPRSISISRLRIVVFTFLLLLIVSSACLPPADPALPPDAPRLEATQARRTADADVRRILSGNPTETPTPGPTPVPRPTCPDAIWWFEAPAYLGQTRTVQGPVVRTRRLANGTASVLEIGQLYPDPTQLTVIVPLGAEDTYAGKSVCVSGVIRAQDAGPSVDATAPSSIRALN